MRHLIHPGHGLTHLIGSLRLFPGCNGDFSDKIIQLFGNFGDLGKNFIRAINELGTAPHPADRSINEFSGVLCGVCRTHGKVPDLISDHCESGPGLPGSGRLNGSVQSQKIGLKGDLINGPDDP